MSNNDDLFHIEQVLSGKTDSFTFVVEKYQHFVYSIAAKVLENKKDIEDVSQESFVKAYRSLNKFKSKSKFSTWLYQITYRTALDYLKRINKHQKTTVQIDKMNPESYFQDPTSSNDEQEYKKRIITLALNNLSKEQQVIVDLYYYKGIAIKDIAVICSISESNAKVQLHRARLKLHSSLNKSFI